MHDALYRGGAHVLPMGDARANSRYSVREDGDRWCYQFVREDSHAFDQATLAKHHSGAGWCSRSRGPLVWPPPFNPQR